MHLWLKKENRKKTKKKLEVRGKKYEEKTRIKNQEARQKKNIRAFVTLKYRNKQL